jgi:glycosyltransferase involved in cell wall biosynthesis
MGAIMSVAIIMRTKDRPLFLKRALESVLTQTYTDWTLALVNDGGDPRELDVLLTAHKPLFGSRLKVLHHEKTDRSGIAAPLNFGIGKTASKWIAVHDDDDSWQPNFLQTCMNYLLAEANAGRHHGGCVTKAHLIHEKIADGALVEERREIYNDWQNFGISLFRLAEGNTIPPISLVFQRAAFNSIGERRDQYGPLEDWEFNLRLFSKYSVGFISQPLANYHLRTPESSAGTNANFFASSANLYGRLDMEVRNDLLRRDLSEGKIGLGFLVNLGQAHGHLFQKIHAFENSVREIEL